MRTAPPPPDEQARLKAVRATGLLDSAPEESFDEIVRLATLVCRTPYGHLGLVDEGRVFFKAHLHFPLRETPRVNLLANAVKFSPGGAQVAVRVLPAQGRVRFEVRDQGPGIAPADVARLFHRFVQLDGSDRRRTGGTGLGLAIAKALVEQHGGSIGVATAPGEGSTFFFEVPCDGPGTPAPGAAA